MKLGKIKLNRIPLFSWLFFIASKKFQWKGVEVYYSASRWIGSCGIGIY